MPDSAPSDRLIAIDLARGITMLGVALVNIHAFAATWSSLYGLDRAGSMADVVAETVTAMLFTHRSYPVLSFLFGAGLALQWLHLAETLRRPRQLRGRLWALLVMGVAHGLLLWPGDVLTTYAVLGLLIVSLLKFDNRVTLGLAVVVYALTAALYVSIGVAMLASQSDPYPAVEAAASFAANSLTVALSRHPGEYVDRGLAQILVSDFWGHALLGMWAARSGALQRYLAAPLARPGITIIGALLFVAGGVTELIAAQYGGWNAQTFADLGYGLMTIALLPASLGGLWFWLTVAACWGSSRFAKSTLASLIVATGRAPLTQFIGQSLVFAVLFNKSLVGWHGELGRGTYSLIALATYLLLCAFLRAWLASGHAHGPMEIVWRRLTKFLSPQRGKSPAIEGPSS
jgi:uncharacterized protein